MPQRRNIRSKPAAAVLSLLLVSLLLVACGGSSSSTTTTATTNVAAATSTNGGRGAFAGRFAAVRECLAKNGITLPKRTPGQARPLGGLLGGVRQLPKGVTQAQYDAALHKCGLNRPNRGGVTSRLASPAYKLALANFAACMRQNGENLPVPNTSGKGPIFNTTGINTSSATFQAAAAKCSAILRSSFAPGSPGSGTPGGGQG
jgi:hypothetical protein